MGGLRSLSGAKMLDGSQPALQHSERRAQYGAGARHAARQGVQAGEARAERSVEDVQAQHVPAYFRAA